MSNPQQASPFFALSAELRNQIYENVLDLRRRHHHHLRWTPSKVPLCSSLPSPSSNTNLPPSPRRKYRNFLLLEHLHHQNERIPCGSWDFRYFDGVNRWAERFWQLIRSLGVTRTKLLHHIVLNCGEWRCKYLEADGSRTGFPNEAEKYVILSDVTHFFQMVQTICAFDFKAKATYHVDRERVERCEKELRG